MEFSLLLAGFVAFVLTAIGGVIIIPFLRRLKFGQSIRDCGPEAHLKKAGTPTMGGLVMIPAVLAVSLLFAEKNSALWLAVFLFVGHAAIGFADDYIKIVLKRNLGLTARQKLFLQTLVAAVFILFNKGAATSIWLPLAGAQLDLGHLYYLLVFLLLLGTTNAVNLTDGLDGLAAGATIPVLLAYAVIAGNTSLAVFSLATAGACAGFLLFNRYPAKVFMGDTGSLALGGAVAALALLTGTELLLVVIGGLYVVEALSVIIQVISFKTRGKRIFRMSPLHHHFELGGWREQKVALAFCLASSACSILGLAIYLLGVQK